MSVEEAEQMEELVEVANGSNGEAIDDLESGDVTDGHMTADEMDQKRKQNMAYEYLCHLEEAKKWIEACIDEELPATTELEENLQNGVLLAKLGHFFAPKVVPLKRIYDKELTRFKQSGLHYRHTDNVVQFFGACENAGLPSIFYPDTSDVYDRKNMPKLIYCIHALSLFLHKLGKAPLIMDLVGTAQFSEEEISAMRAELDKYGIQMPAFGKIGGILANEMPVDEAALHAAVIAINDALDRDDQQGTFHALSNPMALLTKLDDNFVSAYHEALRSAKKMKGADSSTAEDTVSVKTEEKDIYDVILTQAEIQAEISVTNLKQTLKEADNALLERSLSKLKSSLTSSHLKLLNINLDNLESYLDALLKLHEEKQGDEDFSLLNKQDIQDTINSVNMDCNFEYQKNISVDKINKALNSRNRDALFEALYDPKAKYPPVLNFASDLYFEEFAVIREDKGEDLVYAEVHGGVKVLTAVAKVNKAISSSSEELLACLNEEDVHIMAVEAENITVYQQDMTSALQNKQEMTNTLLTHSELQEIIDVANDNVKTEQTRLKLVEEINDVLSNANAEDLFVLLTNEALQFENVFPELAVLYYNCLAKLKNSHPEGQSLRWNEIQSAINLADAQAAHGILVAKAVTAINDAVTEASIDQLCSALTEQELKVKNVNVNCCKHYLEKLDEARKERSNNGKEGAEWLNVELPDGTEMYYNLVNGEHRWEVTDDMIFDSSLLTWDEIQNLINQSTAEEERKVFLNSNEDKIIKLQSAYKGYRARKQYTDRLNYLKNQEPQALKIQAWVKGVQQKKAYKTRQKLFQANEGSIIKIQSAVRSFLTRKAYKNRLNFLANQSDSVIKIQAAWRGKKTRSDYQSLMFAEYPPLNVVRKFAHLLDQSDTDYAEEIEVQKQRQEIVAAIRHNQQLEKDASNMDIKIGLLVKNRITLEEVVTHEGKMSKKEQGLACAVSAGLDSLNKESHERRKAYEHLFYQLQVEPQYLARLILEMPQQQSTKFIESVILTLYNYASNPRDEYLLLKLFSTSLRQEIMQSIENMTDIVTGTPLAIKMVVDFHRNARGHSYLRDMLNPLITSLLEDTSVKINTNPTEVYKNWVNQQETDSGVPSQLPYDVTNEEALKHKEIQELMEESIQQLRSWSDKFLSLILSSLDHIPYGMRYISRVMLQSLTQKFPEASEKDILKIVGNLLYYRYINSTIAAPDAYDIIDIDIEKGGLTPDQRRNLGSIAKILQFAASNKGFGGGDSQHLACLNSYIKGSHEKFKQYFRKACDVPDPEVHFNINQYTEAALVVKPRISISADDLINTHAKLLEYRAKIAPDSLDAIHELLEDLGSAAPTVEELMGSGVNKEDEICLILSSKHEGVEDAKSDLASLLISTKQLTIDIIRCQPGENLTEVLDRETSEDQELQHRSMISLQEQVDARAVDKDAAVSRAKSVKEKSERKMPLKDKKVKVKEDLSKLSGAGFISSDSHYQAMMKLIAQDIRNQRRYRAARRQDLQKLADTKANLQKKKLFFESQIEYYNTYVKACMANMLAAGKRRSRSSYVSTSSPIEEDQKPKKGKKEPKHQTIKYTAAKLHERGIVLEIDGISPNQYKNVQFEISTTVDPAVFQCTAKVLTVSETHTLKLQELLQLQYEGVAVMTLFDRAKINVNLLIHLLNKKFYITK